MFSSLDGVKSTNQRLAEGLRNLRGCAASTTRPLASWRPDASRAGLRVAQVQVEVDDELAKLAELANEAAISFNDGVAELVETGFGTPKALTSKGLGTLRVRKYPWPASTAHAPVTVGGAWVSSSTGPGIS